MYYSQGVFLRVGCCFSYTNSHAIILEYTFLVLEVSQLELTLLI